ncbi:MAG: hypothetical protein M1834_006652 [Cirrosporium novae-zelandiae]|nr:MAG: hypothetical protein M1834_006652 [Cirrosporium novae-zelandiae]
MSIHDDDLSIEEALLHTSPDEMPEPAQAKRGRKASISRAFNAITPSPFQHRKTSASFTSSSSSITLGAIPKRTTPSALPRPNSFLANLKSSTSASSFTRKNRKTTRASISTPVPPRFFPEEEPFTFISPRSPPPRPSRIPRTPVPTRYQRFPTDPDSPSKLSRPSIKLRQLMQPLGPPLPSLPRTLPRSQTLGSNFLTRDPTNYSTDHGIDDCATLPLSPTEKDPNLRLVHSFQPTAWWLGRFVSLNDKFRTEEIENVEPVIDVSKAKPQEDEVRHHRVFMQLQTLCMTNDARKSFKVFQDQIKMGRNRGLGIKQGGELLGFIERFRVKRKSLFASEGYEMGRRTGQTFYQ